MAANSQSDGEPITSRAQLVEYLEGGCKPKDQWRIGTEHEKFAYDLSNFSRLKYDGTPGIAALLEGLMRFDWEPVREGKNVIALRKPDGASVSLEPGGGGTTLGLGMHHTLMCSDSARSSAAASL